MDSLTGFRSRVGEARIRLQVGKPLIVNVFLETGDALIVDVGQAEYVRRVSPAG
jgi:hypothetical protein